MTISTTTRKAGPYAGNGVAVSFAFGFKVFQKSDLRVVLATADDIESTLVLDSDYSVTLNANQDVSPGGSVSYPLVGSPMVAGNRLTLVSDVPDLQQTDITNGSGFYPSVIEDALDNSVILIQQNTELLNRALIVPVSTPNDVSTALPFPAANNVIGWNPDGNALQNFDPNLFASVVAYSTAQRDLFTGDGVQTVFVLTSNPGTQANLDVDINGSTKAGGVDFNWSSGLNVTFTTPPANGARVQIRYQQALPQGTIDAASTSFVAAGVSAVTRSMQDKGREVFSVRDYDAGNDAADFTVAGAENGGGLTLIPDALYSLASFEISADGYYVNNSDTLLSTFLYNAGETPNVKQTKHLALESFSGLNIGKFRIGQTHRMKTTGAGSTLIASGTADVAQLVNAYKTNFNTTTVDGEIDAQIIVVRQGGGTLSDCAGTLYDVATYANSFACQVEGSTTFIDGADNIAQKIRCQYGIINQSTGDRIGYLVEVDAGNASACYQSQPTTNTVTITNVQLHVDPFAPSGNTTVYARLGTGAEFINYRNPLGTTAGNAIQTRTVTVADTNADRLVESCVRSANGTNYDTAQWRLQRTVDGVGLPYVQWAAPGTVGRVGLATAGGTALIYVTDDGFLNVPAATSLFNAANDAAAAALGVPVNGVYRNGSALMVRVA